MMWNSLYDFQWWVTELLGDYRARKDPGTIRDLVASLDSQDDRDMLLQSVFGAALSLHQWDLADLCIDLGVSVDASPEDAADSGPLHAIMENLGDRPEVLRWLISRGAKVDQSAFDGWTALMQAVARGWKESACTLLEEGANINVQMCIDNYDTPLTLAASQGNEAMIQFLLEAGADPTQINRWGDDAARVAEKRGHDECARLIREWRERPSKKRQVGGTGD